MSKINKFRRRRDDADASESIVEKYNVQWRRTYLVGEAQPKIGLRLFKELVQEGSQGLVITHANADDFSRDTGVDRRDITGMDGIPAPEALEKRIREFLWRERFGVILFDAVEGVIKKYGEVRALSLISAIVRLAGSTDSILILSVNPKAAGKKLYGGLISLSDAVVDELRD